MSELRRPRRHYLSKRHDAADVDSDMALVWRAKQEAEPGTALAADFPAKTKLAEAGYTTNEDLDGADEAELRRAGLTSREAEAVLAALA